MKKILIPLLVGVILLPSAAFAQTTTPDRATIIAEIQHLELLLHTLLALEHAQAATTTATTTLTDTSHVTPVEFGAIWPVSAPHLTPEQINKNAIDLENQENAECKHYTNNVPIYSSDGKYYATPVIGTLCVKYSTGGGGCGC